MILALDSNTVTYLLNKDQQVQNKFKKAVDDGNEYIIPPMVYYEVKRWLALKNAFAKSANFDKLCSSTKELMIDEICLNKAIEIYSDLARKGKLIDDGDIFIAAFCLLNDYTLVTNNPDHFGRVEGLKFINWKD